MAIHVALHHKTSYSYDRPVMLGPQVIRLRPAPHCRTPIIAYSLRVSPEKHFVNWQQDPQSNWLARYVFPERTRSFEVEVDLVAEISVINPFDFFLESYAERFPFVYDASLEKELAPYRETIEPGPLLRGLLDQVDLTERPTVDFLVGLNQIVQRRVGYVIRMEPGIQAPEETLELGTGSCRDSAWLLVQALRHLGLAARFCSGYLIQLAPDVKSLDGPSGTDVDFTDLHAWTEVYLPGAGWVGLDPTSGLLTGEGHIPLACSPDPVSAAPITGLIEKSEVTFGHEMSVTRVLETPRVTKPYTDDQWKAVDALGSAVDARLQGHDVRLTMGGEPTFVSIDDMDGPEWNTAAVGPNKRSLGHQLTWRLLDAFGKGGLVHYGQGKWYPGESLPRWAFYIYWRKDGAPLWRDPDLLGREIDYGFGLTTADRFLSTLAGRLGIDPSSMIAAYEDPAHFLRREIQLPVNVTAQDNKLSDPEERDRLARVFERGLQKPVGYVLPIHRRHEAIGPVWLSSAWPLRQKYLLLMPGDSSIGYRLPLDRLPWVSEADYPYIIEADPMEERGPLPQPDTLAGSRQRRLPGRQPLGRRQEGWADQQIPVGVSAGGIARTAIAVEPRDGRIYVFMPPLASIEDWVDLVAAIEETSAELGVPVLMEGYPPPRDPRVELINVTPDPGVIEVNVHPAADWQGLKHTTFTLYEEARQSRLGSEKFMVDGRHVGTGGGNHIVVGAARAPDSPFLRRPDLLRSLITFWQHHPSLSYLFSGLFIGPTSQAPRVDEARNDTLYELEIAFEQIDRIAGNPPPWLIDRILRNLLTDATGNTHRAEFCIDKLYSPDSSSGRLGLVEFRNFEMPPHPQMSLVQQLLLRALIVRFWEKPYRHRLVRWGTELNDRFMLPHYLWLDLQDVLADLRAHGLEMKDEWFLPHFHFRFPVYGSVQAREVRLELRSALEPWHVLGEEPGGGGTVRYVDSSVERLQLLADGMTGERYAITCNGRRVPLTPTGTEGQHVSGIRFRAWWPANALHPTIPIHAPLVFDVVDSWSGRSIGGCTYHVAHPGGRNYETSPVNAYEAEGRRLARFFPFGHTPGPMEVPPSRRTPEFPTTLDMRLGD
ncbi:transglutaminase family protein [Radicibacter daui]|uniref:transglutaminase family protein n=1 Tax=Radicibacter daui TaxID=3064829 RepID=UPI004046E0E3